MSDMRFELPRRPLSVLSKREQEVLLIVACDKTDREIARLLGIRERTVRAHLSRIILKLGVASRVGAAVAFAHWSARRSTCPGGGCGMAEPPLVTANPQPRNCR